MKGETGNEMNLIGQGTVFEGKLKTAGNIRIDGRVIGDIVVTQNISIGATGDIDGNVSARNITIGGKVKGALVAQEKMVFESRAVIRGEIRAAKLVIDEGALFDGKCVMSEAKPMASVVELKPEIRRAEER